MKIKFEIRLTASKALLAVLAAMVGMSVQAEDKKEPAEKRDVKEIIGDIQKVTNAILEGSQQTDQAPVVEKLKATRTRTTAPKADPIPEKIVPPPTLKAEEAIEQEEQGVCPPPEEPEVEITIEEVRGFGGSLIQKNDVKFRPLVMAVLQAHGASKFSELTPSEFAGTLADLKALQ